MRDHTSNLYCDILWIHDLLSLKKSKSNDFYAELHKRGKRTPVRISHVTIFGTVVEIRQLGEKGIIYSVDDGTGIICCKYSGVAYNEIVDKIQAERSQILNETFSSRCNQSINESQLNYSTGEDDTIFNDYSLQEEELAAMNVNKLKALHSIWLGVEESFSGMTQDLDIGDTVLIEGKLYEYFGTNQIHVNVIRSLDVEEELILTHVKLRDGCDPIFKCGKTTAGASRNPAARRADGSRNSGLMTFDHIHHMETREQAVGKCILPGGTGDGRGPTRKRKSIVPPQLEGSITFDTLLTDLDESADGRKVPRLDRDS